MQHHSPGRSLVLDYAFGIFGVWIAGGVWFDTWAHGHVPVESFFTPYHGIVYAGGLTGLIFTAVFAFMNHRRGYAWSDVFPAPYRRALIGLPIFILAGFGDLVWHTLLGLEEGVDAVLSPTHQALGLGILFLASGPIRSVLADRARSTTFARQLPAALGLATWLMIVHFGTAFAFDPAAGRTNAPPPIAPFTADYLTAVAIGYYKSSAGVVIVMVQSLLIAGFTLWLISKIRPRPGIVTLFLLLANVPAAAAFTNHTPLLAVTFAQSLITGLVADVYLARVDLRPPNASPAAFRWFAIAVPMTYIGVYLLGTLAADGLWWDWNVSLGAWLWAGVSGWALHMMMTARSMT